MKHDWHMIIEFSNGESVDQVWYCKSCGVVKKTYTHRNGSADPVYFGVDVEPHTLDQPACTPPRPSLEARVSRLELLTSPIGIGG